MIMIIIDNKNKKKKMVVGWATTRWITRKPGILKPRGIRRQEARGEVGHLESGN